MQISADMRRLKFLTVAKKRSQKSGLAKKYFPVFYLLNRFAKYK